MPREHDDTSAQSPVVEGSFDAGGVCLRYVEAGAGEPVVLVHSYTSDLDSMWRETGVLDALATAHRTIALDLRGHGRSDKPHDPRAYGAQMTWDIARLLDHLRLERAHVVGYSLGAHLVAQLLTLAPQRCATATLGGASGRRHWTQANDAQAELEAREMEQGRLDAQLVRLWPTDRPAPVAAQLRDAAANLLVGKDPRALAAVRRSNRDQSFATSALATVRVPVLGMVGSRDPYRLGLEELVGVLPDFELVIIDDATHANAHAKSAFTATLLRFLRAHPLAR
jgi:pimeloyl-ACP methyl ester carboxylesterase